MADTPKYSSIIDEFLDSREPDWKDLGLKDAKKSGDEWLSKTHDEADALLEELAGASKHTAVPPTSKGATLQNRMLDKENAAPRMGSGRTAQARTAGNGSEDDSLVEEITESFEEAAKSGRVEKKHRSDAEIKNYVKQLLNQGVPPAKVAAQLSKLAELELFNHQMGTRYLQDNAGLIGMAYMEPNTFMDKQNPNYERKTAYSFNSVSEQKQQQEAGGVVSQIRPGDRVTITTSHGQEMTGRAVMYNAQQQCWVLNMGGKHGTPGIADETNIVKVRKAPSKRAANPAGLFVGNKAWESVPPQRSGYYEENPPDDWEECGQCECYHPAGFTGDCRDDINRWPSDESIAAMTTQAPNEHMAAVGDTGWAEGENTEAKPTPVIFRKWKDTGDILALFPYDLGTDSPYTCSSYEHVGQHGAADPRGCIQQTKPAKPEEYAALKAELESLGYKLKPMSRLQYDALLSRENQLKQYHSNDVPEANDGMQTVEPGYKSTTFSLDDEEAPKQASSQDCVRQAKTWKAAGIQPRAKSVKQITACEGCTYFKKNGGSKTCGLYGLPVISNAKELTSIVNKLTAGVPASSKRAALVQIANRTQEHNPIAKAASSEAPFVHQSSFTKERQFGFAEPDHFSGSLVQKLHTAGHSLKAISEAADKKYGALEASKGIREFLAALRKEKGKIVMAKADADYLKKIGIHNEAIVGASKCASCKSHDGKQVRKAASSEMVTRAPETFVESTLGGIRASHHTTTAHFDSAAVAKLHTAGHNIDKIFKAASAKYGSAQASKAVRDWANNLKNTNTKIALSQIDCTTLKKMGVKLGSQNAIVGAEKCGSCNYRNGMHCGLTGGTLLSFPGMNKVTSNKKVASGAPEDGRSILKEFDLMGSSAQADIDMKAPDRAEIQMGSKPDAGEI
jgi:hypothetical protein